MPTYIETISKLKRSPRTWLVTGAAGFIGSNIVETLLQAGQRVRGLDNFSTGHLENLKAVQTAVGGKNFTHFAFTQGDIRDLETCHTLCQGVDYVVHQAAIGSVPRSIEDPLFVNANNVDGFLNILVAARDARVRSFVYAASSSTYGDEPSLPKQEEFIGKPLSPYAVTKYVNELYAQVFANTYGIKSIGLRYFNIFGPRQDPTGAYAAVVPQWFSALIKGEQIFINGDGETSRDFCYIDDCVQANILAACCEKPEAYNKVFNIARGERTSLNELFHLLRQEVVKYNRRAAEAAPVYRDFRSGDVRHSVADVSLAKKLLGYTALFSVHEGIKKAASWYVGNA